MTRSPRPSHSPTVSARRPHRQCLIRAGTARFADRTVLDGVDLAVGPADRLAVIGDNGSGKSTLLRVLAGVLPLSAGQRDVHLPGGLALAEQRPEFAPGTTVAGALDVLLADVRRLEAEMREVADELARAGAGDQTRLLDRLSYLMDRFDARDGYQLDQRVDASLEQLSLGHVERSRPVHSLSGGESARLALAAALSSRAELLLLDEPSLGLAPKMAADERPGRRRYRLAGGPPRAPSRGARRGHPRSCIPRPLRDRHRVHRGRWSEPLR